MIALVSVVTALSLATFVGVVIWAWSGSRTEANHASAMLPFDLPDESTVARLGKEAEQ